MADRVVQIAVEGEYIFALTESGRLMFLWCAEQGMDWEELPPVPGCEPVQAEDPWRDLTNAETVRASELAARHGRVVNCRDVAVVWDAIRKARGGGQAESTR